MFPDANLDRVVDAVADGIFYSTGEICDAFSRALVHEDVLDEFTERFVKKARSYVLGDPLDEETTMGPLTSREQFETVSDYVETGKGEATLLCGGGQPDDSQLEDGWYFEPTVFGDVENEMDVACEEIFGPVQTIIRRTRKESNSPTTAGTGSRRGSERSGPRSLTGPPPTSKPA